MSDPVAEVAETVQALDLTNKPDENHSNTEDFVDPWNVVSTSQTGIDYDKLISKSCNVTFVILPVKLQPYNYREVWLFKNRLFPDREV